MQFLAGTLYVVLGAAVVREKASSWPPTYPQCFFRFLPALFSFSGNEETHPMFLCDSAGLFLGRLQTAGTGVSCAYAVSAGLASALCPCRNSCISTNRNITLSNVLLLCMTYIFKCWVISCGTQTTVTHSYRVWGRFTLM